MEAQTEQNIEIVPTGDTLWRASRHFLVLLHFICMKISHGSIIYIIDEGSRSALQSLEQNFFIFFSMIPPPPPPPPPPLPPPPRRHPLLSSCSSHPSFIPTSTRLVSSPIPAPFHPSPALWSLIISSFHKSNLTSLLPPIRLSSFTYAPPPPNGEDLGAAGPSSSLLPSFPRHVPP